MRGDAALEDRVLMAVSWVAQGPSPIEGGQVEGMGSQNNPVAGALHTVVTHPTDAATLWAGGTNGGVWRTTNGTASGPSWTPLTDHLPNQSIGALALDPTDPGVNTILAGYGANSSFGQSSGRLEGLIRTTDGGASWAQLGTTFFSGQSISGIAGRGNLILASSNEFFGSPGVSRSVDGGLSFARVSGTGGLPNVGAFDLVEDPTNFNRFYVGTDLGIFRTQDGGASWANVTPPGGQITASGAAATTNIEMAVGRATGVLYVAVVNNGRVATLSRSADQGATWQALGVPEVAESQVNTVTGASNASPIVITSATAHGQRSNDRVQVAGVTGNTAANGTWTVTVLNATQFSLTGSVGNGAYGGGGNWRAVQGLQPNEHPGAQGTIHLSIAADPNNPNLVYVGGDRQPLSNGASAGGFPNSIGATNFTGRLFRGDASLPVGSQWTPITNNFADPDGPGTGQPGSSPHADSREITFDANGNLVQTDDGGIYRRLNPTSPTGVWRSLNGNIQIGETYPGGLGYDPLNNILIAGSQDAGSSQQKSAGSTVWEQLNQGDGSQIQSADLGNGTSVRYTSSQFFGGGPGGFRRLTYNSGNVQLSNAAVGLVVTNVGTGTNNLYQVDGTIPFVTPYELNTQNPSRMVIGTAFLYESTNSGQTLTRLAVPQSFTRALAYGGPGNADLLWYGGNDFPSELMVRTAGTGTPTLVATFPGFFTRDIAVGTLSAAAAYVIDLNGRIYRTTDAGATAGNWSDLTGNFAALDPDARQVTAVAIGPAGSRRDLVVVGGIRGVHAMDTANPGVWFELGTGLPNTILSDIRHSAVDDLLYAGTQGRGAWTVAGFTSQLAGDSVRPTVALQAVSPNPRATPVSSLAITFSEPVNGFSLADLRLTRNGANVPLNLAAQPLGTADLVGWTLGNLAGLTAASGSYTLTLVAAASGIADGAGNALLVDAVASFVVDATSPTVASVGSPVANGLYGIGAVIPITVAFGEPVVVTGTPTLALNAGAGAVATYVSGSGTNTLTFRYVVAAGQAAADLDYASALALAPAGGTIADPVGNAAVLTLVAPGAAGSLGASKDVAIDGITPTVLEFRALFGSQSFDLLGSSRILPWQVTGFRAVFSEPIAAGGIGSLGGFSNTGFGGLGTNTLTWAVDTITQGNFSASLLGSIGDAAGNPLAPFARGLRVLYGDFNGDGFVSSADVTGVNNELGGVYNLFVDINGDGVEDVQDLLAVRRRIGKFL